MENQEIKRPRKLLKVKRTKTTDIQQSSFGTPAKVSNLLSEDNGYTDISSSGNYFAENGEAENIRFITEEDLTTGAGESIKTYLQNKTVVMMLVIAALFGAIVSYMMAPAPKSRASRGLDGIVFNPDVPSGRNRCGLVEPHQGCVLYIMNPKNQEVTGKDFYSTAAKWTGRERYLIETSNMHYSSTRIKPGYIAQINIPSLSY